MIEIPIEIPVSGFPARPRPFSPTVKKKRNREGGDDDYISTHFVSRGATRSIAFTPAKLSDEISRLVSEPVNKKRQILVQRTRTTPVSLCVFFSSDGSGGEHSVRYKIIEFQAQRTAR